MIATKLDAIPGISPATAKAILVLGLGAVSAALVALVQAGAITGVAATLAPIASAFITGLAALIDPNATHDAA